MNKKLAEFLNVLFGFRKMLVIMVLFGVGILFRLKGLVNGAEMVDLFKTTAIAFMAANGISKVVNAVKEHAIAKTTAEVTEAAVTENETDLEISG